MPEHPDIINLGFVSEQDEFDALKASKLLVMPSPYESLSMVLLEAWLAERTLLLNRTCDVLFGQCKRSNGGLAYGDYHEFKESLDFLLTQEHIGCKLGEQGKQYVEVNYKLDAIERKYLGLSARLS